jgi:hypothetical protein
MVVLLLLLLLLLSRLISLHFSGSDQPSLTRAAVAQVARVAISTPFMVKTRRFTLDLSYLTFQT